MIELRFYFLIKSSLFLRYIWVLDSLRFFRLAYEWFLRYRAPKLPRWSKKTKDLTRFTPVLAVARTVTKPSLSEIEAFVGEPSVLVCPRTRSGYGKSKPKIFFSRLHIFLSRIFFGPKKKIKTKSKKNNIFSIPKKKSEKTIFQKSIDIFKKVDIF